MFSNLIESGSHAADLKRKGRFFLGTIAFYCLLLAATGVGSIYAYNAKLDDPSNDLEVTLLRFPPAEARSESDRREQTRPAAANHQTQVATRPEISIETPYHGDRIASETTPEISARTPVVIANYSSNPITPGGPTGPDVGGLRDNLGREIGPTVRDVDTPPPARVSPTPAPVPQKPSGPVLLPSSLISSKTVSKPAPPYPMIAKETHTQGPVVVQIVIDEQGHVISAKALSGSPLLQAAAVQAAYQARFTPTILGGQAVKITGSITYNFVLN
jgi:periplasmic protein TonB